MNLPDIIASSTTTDDWKPFVAGEVHMLREDGEGKLSAGLWRVTPEQATKDAVVPCHQDETVYIIYGRITVKSSDGETHELKAGSFASFRKGSVNTWSIHEPTMEFFVYS